MLLLLGGLSVKKDESPGTLDANLENPPESVAPLWLAYAALTSTNELDKELLELDEDEGRLPCLHEVSNSFEVTSCTNLAMARYACLTYKIRLTVTCARADMPQTLTLSWNVYTVRT